MKSKDFDNMIRKKLNEHIPPYHPERWEAFVQRLNEEESRSTQQDEVDEWVAYKLDQLSPSYEEAHWNRLAGRMAQERKNRRNIWLSKSLESVLLLLLLFIWGQTIELRQNDFQPSGQAFQQIEKEPGVAGPDDAKGESTETSLRQTDIEDYQGSPESPEAFSAVSPAIPVGPPASPSAGRGDSPELSAVPSIGSRRQDDQATVDRLPEIAPEVENQVFEPGFPAFLWSDKDQAEPVFLAPLAGINAEAQASFSAPALTAERIASAPVRRAGAQGWFANGFLSADYNIILTPYDQDFAEEAYMQGSYSYGAGFSISRKKRRWEWSLAAAYHHVRYEPRSLVEIFDGSVSEGGYFADELEQIELNTLQVPLSLRYYAIDGEKLQVFASTGVGMRVALQTFYDFKRRFVAPVEPESSIIPGGPGVLPPPNRNNQPEEESRLSRRDQTSGVLEGGNFERNHYFTAQGGLGFVYWTSKRYGLFGEGIYNHQLFIKEIGPNRDRINNLSFQLGFRVKL